MGSSEISWFCKAGSDELERFLSLTVPSSPICEGDGDGDGLSDILWGTSSVRDPCNSILAY